VSFKSAVEAVTIADEALHSNTCEFCGFSVVLSRILCIADRLRVYGMDTWIKRCRWLPSTAELNHKYLGTIYNNNSLR